MSDRAPEAGAGAARDAGGEAAPGSTSGGGDASAVGADGSGSGKRPHVVRRLYEWVLHWANTPYGPWALFWLSFAESSFFPIPPDPLLMALCLGRPKKSLRFAGICLAGSVLGGFGGYLIGWGLWSGVDQFFYAYVPGVSPEAFDRVQGLYVEYDFWAVFVSGLTPLPYKVFTISSGVFGINLLIFGIASLLSRGLRFFAVAGLIYRFGRPVSDFIDRYFDLVTIVFTVLLVGGFLVIEFVL